MSELMRDAIEAINCAYKETNETKSEHPDAFQAKLDQLDSLLDRTLMRCEKATAVPNRPAFSDAVEEKSDDFADFIRSGTPLETKALTAQTGESGGYMIPAPARHMIEEKLNAHTPLRQLASVTTISTDAIEFLLDKGQLDVGWVTETQERSETKMSELTKMRINVHEVYARPRVSQKMLDDASINIDEWLSQKIATKMAAVENIAFLNGDGATQPKGFMTYPTQANKAEWGKFEHLDTGVKGALRDAGVLIDAMQKLEPKYLMNAVWMMSRSTLATLRKLRDKNENFLWQPALMAGTPSMLLGHPVIVCDEMPAITPGQVSTPIVFGDFRSAYHIVDRQGMNIVRDPYSAKPFVEFYATKRVGGDVVDFSALKFIRTEG